MEIKYKRNKKVERIIKELGSDALVLDVGGWAAPFPLATHVVDIMPYETRGGGYSEMQHPEERFTKETWIMKDVTHPNFSLPFEDDFFDYSVCMHTIEDLHEVRPLIWELERVSNRGYIETPSRLKEQTVGISDRSCKEVGYNHHKWIVEYKNKKVQLYDKKESTFQPDKEYEIPLCYETDKKYNEKIFWKNKIDYEIITDHKKCVRKAKKFKKDLGISKSKEYKDKILRLMRRIRNRLRGRSRYPTV